MKDDPSQELAVRLVALRSAGSSKVHNDLRLKERPVPERSSSHFSVGKHASFLTAS
jgi:hypothetical protein